MALRIEQTIPASEFDHTKAPSRVLLAAVVPVALVLTMWAVFLVDVSFDLGLHRFGVRPRAASGTIGIFTSPFLHGSLEHLINNSVPMLVLGWSLFYFYPRISWRVLGWAWLFTGLWVWISARTSYHIGASGVVYALAAFLFFSGVLRRHTKLMALSLMVVFVYGSLVWGILPILVEVSWESHLWGGVAGLLLAIYFRKRGPQRKRFPWEDEPDEPEPVQEEGPLPPDPRPSEYIYHYRPRERDDLSGSDA